jgi:ubiquinone/menaquinone biosynthesis C-methylase UbiE
VPAGDEPFVAPKRLMVAFCCGNALAMPSADHMFDVVSSQEAWVHIPNKARLLAAWARVLIPGGRLAFTDLLRTFTMQPADLARVQPYWGQFRPETFEGYGQLLAAAGLPLVEREDVSRRWAVVLSERAESVRRVRHELVR